MPLPLGFLVGMMLITAFLLGTFFGMAVQRMAYNEADEPSDPA